jgi:hypothetical protein
LKYIILVPFLINIKLLKIFYQQFNIMSIFKNIQKSIKTHHVLAIIGLVVAVFAVMQYSGKKGRRPDGFSGNSPMNQPQTNYAQPGDADGQNGDYGSATELSTTSIGLPPSCSAGSTITNPADLLPNDENSEWATLNPAGVHDFNGVNLLKAGYHVGINTQGQSLRNANYQLRSEPPNPTTQVSPWNITTIEPDTNRRPLEIGGDY